VNLLGDLEEPVIATDDAPVGDEPEIVEDGNDRAQQL
jgi:hypothetical protein